MTTYAVVFKGRQPVGIVTKNKKVTVAHPDVGHAEGKHIDEVIKLVKKKHGIITRIK